MTNTATTTKKAPTPWAALAATARREIKARRDALGIPTAATIKVTSDSFAGGASVDVRISGVDEWAWRDANDLDHYARPGERVLRREVLGPIGDAIAEMIRAAREAQGDADYCWIGVTYHGASIGGAARKGWTGGLD